jgi:hypothetical protein
MFPEATVPFEERCAGLDDDEVRPVAIQLEVEQVQAAFISLQRGK